MPEYLALNNYETPLDPADGIFQYTKGGWKGDLFNYYEAHPREGESFNQVMGGVMAHQAGWLDIFPHRSLLNSDPNRALLVDVGGNVGHDVEKFRQAYPETAARLYLQDRPEVVRLSKCPDPVNKMGYDFFTPQPVQGKMTYPGLSKTSPIGKMADRSKLQVLVSTTCTGFFMIGRTNLRARY